LFLVPSGQMGETDTPCLHLPLSDHEVRNAWIGPSFPLDLSTLPVSSEQVPLQYPSLSAHRLFPL